jgi:hypothetical protein
MAPRQRTLLACVGLVAAVGVGLWLRMLPCSLDPDSTLIGDSAFHFRLVQSTRASGSVPVVDSLASAPHGRVVRHVLPIGLYAAGSAWDRIAERCGMRDARLRAHLFVALAGALIAVPVFVAARALFGGYGGPLLAALVAVVLPGHLHRSFCYWFRYDALGTLLIACHLALGCAALVARNRGAWSLAGLAGVALLGALSVWRLALGVPALEALFVVGWTLSGRPAAMLRPWFTATALAVATACLAIGYLRFQSFLFSLAPLLVVTVAAALWLRPFAAPGAIRIRALLLAAALAVALLGQAAVPRERQYQPVLQAAIRKLTSSADRGAASPMTQLALHVEELEGATPISLFGPAHLSGLGWVLLAVPLLLVTLPRRSGVPERGPAIALAAFTCVALLAATLMFERAKVLLAPVAAVFVGDAFARTWPWLARQRPPAATSRARKPARSGGRPGRPEPVKTGRAREGVIRVLVAALWLAGFAIAARDACRLAATRVSRLPVGLAGALEHLRRTTAAPTVVLSTWERGYEIQTYAGRRTVVDGLLEDPETQRRIIEIAAAALQPAADSLAGVCRRYGATHLLLPPSTFLGAILTEAPATMAPELAELRRKVLGSIAITPQEANRVVVRMMVLGESPPPFEKTFEQEQWRVYRLQRWSPGGGPAGGS